MTSGGERAKREKRETERERERERGVQGDSGREWRNGGRGILSRQWLHLFAPLLRALAECVAPVIHSQNRK